MCGLNRIFAHHPAAGLPANTELATREAALAKAPSLALPDEIVKRAKTGFGETGWRRGQHAKRRWLNRRGSLHAAGREWS
jgi:hypothetical protein